MVKMRTLIGALVLFTTANLFASNISTDKANADSVLFFDTEKLTMTVDILKNQHMHFRYKTGAMTYRLDLNRLGKPTYVNFSVGSIDFDATVPMKNKAFVPVGQLSLKVSQLAMALDNKKGPNDYAHITLDSLSLNYDADINKGKARIKFDMAVNKLTVGDKSIGPMDLTLSVKGFDVKRYNKHFPKLIHAIVAFNSENPKEASNTIGDTITVIAGEMAALISRELKINLEQNLVIQNKRAAVKFNLHFEPFNGVTADNDKKNNSAVIDGTIRINKELLTSIFPNVLNMPKDALNDYLSSIKAMQKGGYMVDDNDDYLINISIKQSTCMINQKPCPLPFD